MRLYNSYPEAQKGLSQGAQRVRVQANWNTLQNYKDVYYRGEAAGTEIYIDIAYPYNTFSIEAARELGEELIRQAEFFSVLNAVLDQEKKDV